MRCVVIGAHLGVAVLALAAVTARADQVTVSSILAAQHSGASARGIIAMINDPANVIEVTADDLLTLRRAGVPESVITAAWAQVPAPSPAQAPLQPDDPRLVNFERLIASGMSEDIIAEQITKSGEAYSLSVNDLLYLKQHDARESTIAALMATTRATTTGASGTLPVDLEFDNLVLVKKGMWGFLKKDRAGRLVMDGNTLRFEDQRGADGSFEFQVEGIDKVWLTCEARSSGNFCHQINFKIVKGDRYRFQDSGRDTGSNTAVLAVMEALRTNFPRVTIARPSVDD